MGDRQYVTSKGLLIFPVKGNEKLKDVANRVNGIETRFVRFLEFEDIDVFGQRIDSKRIKRIQGQLKKKFQQFNPEKDFVVVGRRKKKAKPAKVNKKFSNK